MTSQDATTATAKTFGERWTEMYQRLVKFKEANGHCLVPNRYPEDKKLGAWVSAQRRHYKILTSGKKESTPMTLERAQKLIDIGFDWSTSDPRHVSWDERFEQLRQFKMKYGHVQVPMGWSENSSLSNWVSAQRQDYKLYNKGRPSRLTQDKIDRLDHLGFVWEAQRGGRRRKLEPLSEMKDVPASPAADKSDPPGEKSSSRLPSASEAIRAASARRPQGIPSSLMAGGNAALFGAGYENPLAQQALLRAGASGVMGSSLLDQQNLLTPLQQRQLLAAQFGTPGVFPGGSIAGGLLSGSPLCTQTDVYLRLQQQEQFDRAAFAASLAARETLMGVPTGMPTLPLGAAAPGAAMMGHLGGAALVPGRAAMLSSSFRPTDQSFRLASTNNSSTSSRERKRANPGIGELFDPSLPDPPQDDTRLAAKRAKREAN